MAPKTTTFTSLLLLFLLFFHNPFVVYGGDAELQFLKVHGAEFSGSVRNAIDVLHGVASTVQSDYYSKGSVSADSRQSSALSACLELMMLSSHELSRAVSAIENPQGKRYGTGNLNSDLRTWLSAALVNTDTCMDGFQGTRNDMKDLISNSLNKVNSLVQELLTQMHPVSINNDFTTKLDKFPSWVEPRDQKLLLIKRKSLHVDAVVAADGSGNYTTVMDAVLAAPMYKMKRYVIRIKKGVYEENVVIDMSRWNLVMIGDGMHSTIITGNLSYSANCTTFKTATFAVNAMGFLARDISFRNTAGPERHQAVALRSDSDLSVFYRCGIFGYQDTLYAHALRQFYRECVISGTVDFIFGYAAAVFQKCTILAKKGLPRQRNTITAQGGNPYGTSGFTIQHSYISADYDLSPSVDSNPTFLGRPWKPYSRTIFMQSYISDVVRPEGWVAWNGSSYLDTLYYGEFMNFGPGAAVGDRVNWPGYHVMNDSWQVSNFTVASLLLGNLWLPSTGVTYSPGV